MKKFNWIDVQMDMLKTFKKTNRFMAGSKNNKTFISTDGITGFFIPNDECMLKRDNAIPSTMCEKFIEDADKVLSNDSYTKLINPKLSVIIKDGKKQTRYIYKAEDESLYWTVAEDVLRKFPENIMIYTTGRNSMAYVYFTGGDPLGVMMPIREDKAEQIYNSLD